MREWQHRWHVLRKEWMLVAARTGDRPWSGAKAVAGEFDTVEFDPGCYLCPGNQRASGARNPEYRDIFVFENDFASWSNLCPPAEPEENGFFRTFPVQGAGRVVCYEHSHHLTMAQLPVEKIVSLFRTLREEYIELGSRPEIKFVHIFENKGKIVGVSNPHPHCQIYGSNRVFPLIQRELEACREYANRTRSNLLLDLVQKEIEQAERVIFSHAGATAFVPFAARFPYESWLVPHSQRPSLAEMDLSDLQALAHGVKEMAVRYDNLFRMSFPYVMVLHQAPVDGLDYSHYQFHIEFYPVLRNPAAQKFLAGPELGGDMMINPKQPEAAAHELREVSARHFLQGGDHD